MIFLAVFYSCSSSQSSLLTSCLSFFLLFLLFLFFISPSPSRTNRNKFYNLVAYHHSRNNHCTLLLVHYLDVNHCHFLYRLPYKLDDGEEELHHHHQDLLNMKTQFFISVTCMKSYMNHV